MIRELAMYEKAPQEVTITEEELLRDGFGKSPAYRFIVGLVDDEVGGFALFYPRYSTWKGRTLYLEDLLVKEQFRRSGLGTALFDEVVERARSEEAQRLEWQVLEWNTPAIDFYKKYSSAFDSEWINGRLTYDQIQGKHSSLESHNSSQ